jgi:hypothetical protein
LPQVEELFLPAVLDDRIMTVKMDGSGETDAERIVVTAFYVPQPIVHREREAVELESNGVWQMLLMDREGRLQ